MSAVLRKTPGLEIVIGHNQLMRGEAADGQDNFVGNPLENFPWSIPAALFRREVFSKIGLFDETLRFGEDADWFRRAQEAGLAIERLPQISLLVRRHEVT